MNLEMENLPPGFRFHPTDEELITYYLSHKVSDAHFMSRVITDVDLNKCEPWDLPEKAILGEKEWYFFSLRDRKYPTGLRTNRATNAGYWKTTGKDKEICQSGVLVGLKKTLVFYKGRAPKGEKTNWVMHEYRLENKTSYKPAKDEWMVCRVFQKSSSLKKPQQDSSLDLAPCDATAMVNELGEIEQPLLGSNNNNNNIDVNMDWASEAMNHPLLNWPSNVFSSSAAMNSVLLTALQLSGYQSSSGNDICSLLPQGSHRFGTDINEGFGPSSSKYVDYATQVPSNTDSIW